MRLMLEPAEGTIWVIEGAHRKTGKSLLMTDFSYNWLDTVPDGLFYGNFHLDHPRAKYVKKLTENDFPWAKNEEEIPVLVGIQEADLRYPPQEWHDNLDLFVFAGLCAHLYSGLIMDFQNNYRLPRDVADKVNCHLFTLYTYKNKKTGLPFRVDFQIRKPARKRTFKIYTSHFDKYNCREFPLPRIDFTSFTSKKNDETHSKDEKVRLRCDKCGYEWEPKKSHPKGCPNPKCRKVFGYRVIRP